MKIEVHKAEPEPTFEEFATKNDLVMEVVEHSPDYITASFKNCEVKDGVCLVSQYGIGRSQADAINDYKRLIAGELLVRDAYKSSRKEMQCPEKWREE